MISRLARPVLLLLFATPVAGQTVRLHTGLSVSSGDYLFTERTTTWALSTAISARSGTFTLRAGVPVYFQNSTLVAGSSAGHIPTGGSSSGTVADSGRHHQGDGSGGMARMLAASHGQVEVPASAATGYEAAVGDPDLALRWQGIQTGSTGVAFGARVKVPLADTATFGTGEWDVGAQVSLDRSLGEHVWAALDVSYWALGDLPDLELRDPVSGMASLSYLAGSGWSWSLLGHASTAIVEGFEGPAAVGASLTRAGAGRSGWTLVSLVGLTETTPDLTVGLAWSLRLRD